MKVRYNPVVAALFIVLGGVLGLLALWLLLLGTFSIGVIIGPLLLLVGIRYLVSPYFEVSRHGVTVIAPFGNGKEYPGRFVLEGGRPMVVTPGGGRTKVRVSRWLANGTDWAKLEAYAAKSEAGA